MPSIDIGANLAHDSFDADRDDVLQRARAAELSGIVITGSCVASNQAAIALARAQPGYCYATAGLHPHHASDMNAQTLAALDSAMAQPEVLAAGEMGLDYFRHYSPHDAQQRAFEAQLQLALKHQKPVFLHERDAYPRFGEILAEYRPQLVDAVVHCFTGSRQALHCYLDLGCYIGITGWVCDERRGRELYELVRDIPAERLLVETDSPYLLPRNIRPKPASRRNEPMYLSAVIATLAQARSEDKAQLAIQCTDNARRLFRWPE